MIFCRALGSGGRNETKSDPVVSVGLEYQSLVNTADAAG